MTAPIVTSAARSRWVPPGGRFSLTFTSLRLAQVVCKHWLRGLCKKGDNCEFLHEYDLSKMPPCHFFINYGPQSLFTAAPHSCCRVVAAAWRRSLQQSRMPFPSHQGGGSHQGLPVVQARILQTRCASLLRFPLLAAPVLHVHLLLLTLARGPVRRSQLSSQARAAVGMRSVSRRLLHRRPALQIRPVSSSARCCFASRASCVCCDFHC